MVENRSSIFGIIAIIIGASGLGLGAFSILNLQVVEGPPGPPGQDETLDNVVGIWESLSANIDYAPHTTSTNYLIMVNDTQVINNYYCYLSRSNTRFHLNKSGWYRVVVVILLASTAGFSHELRAYKNGGGSAWLNPAYVISDGSWVGIETSFYIPSNGTDYYDFSIIGGVSSVTASQVYNQLAIEYVGEY